jgi:hypothetical protein
MELNQLRDVVAIAERGSLCARAAPGTDAAGADARYRAISNASSVHRRWCRCSGPASLQRAIAGADSGEGGFSGAADRDGATPRPAVDAGGGISARSAAAEFAALGDQAEGGQRRKAGLIQLDPAGAGLNFNATPFMQ